MEKAEFGNIVVTKDKTTQHLGDKIKYIPTKNLDGCEISYKYYNWLLYLGIAFCLSAAAGRESLALVIVGIILFSIYFFTRSLNLIVRSGNIVMFCDLGGKNLSHANEFIEKVNAILNQKVV